MSSTDTDATIPLGWHTDVGRRYEHNEDSFAAAPPLLAVADGVGGSARGEVASRVALDALAPSMATVHGERTADDAIRAMERAVVGANEAVHTKQELDPDLRGMATTLTAAVLRDGGEVIVGHVGDSRLYVVSAAGARLVTHDHSVVAELVRTGRLEPEAAASHPQRNVITRALGVAGDVSVDAFVLHVGPGDWLLVCSDGLTEHVGEELLASLVLEHAPTDPHAAARALVDAANDGGGSDNITVVLAQPVPSDVSGQIQVQSFDAVDATGSMPAVRPDADEPTSAIPAIRASGGATATRPSPSELSGEMPALQPLALDDKPYVDHVSPPPSVKVRTVLAVVAALLVAAVAGGFVWSQSYFLVERSDGRVGIDRGFPLPGLSRRVRTSDVRAEDLSGSDRDHLVSSHDLLSRSDAARVLDELPQRVRTTGSTTTEDASALTATA